MSPIKNTYKTTLLANLFANNSMFAGIDLQSADMTNAIAEKIANSKGYFWRKSSNTWVFKAATSIDGQGWNGEDNFSNRPTERTLLVRLMADRQHLQEKLSDTTLALELAGYNIVMVSPMVSNRGSKTWARVYITAERED